MRRQIAALIIGISCASAQAAGGAWDGIYNCGIQAIGQSYNVYMTINGQPDGRAIWAVAAITRNADFWGYGIGSISNGQFSGVTDVGAPFTLNATPTGLSGSVGTYYNGKLIFVTGACFKVW